MASTFFDRIDSLSRQVGHGDLVGKVEVDQVYAHYQETGDDFEHPRGGRSRFLSSSLFDKTDERMEKLARHAITEDGSQIEHGMAEAMEDLSDDVFERAPVEFFDLRNSGHPTVTSDGAEVYNRPPNVHRLSKEELKYKHRLRVMRDMGGLRRSLAPRPRGFDE